MSRDIANSNPVATHQLPELSFLLPPIRKAAQTQFNGNLLLRWDQAAPWGLTFRHGRLIWGWAGQHRLRRWRCLLGPDAPKAILHPQAQGFASTTPVWEYEFLNSLVKQGKLQRPTAQDIARQNLAEVLFDLVQMFYLKDTAPQLESEAFKVDQPLKFFAPSEICLAVHKTWGAWCDAQLQNYSPMLAPCIYQPAQLRSLMSERSYRNLEQLLQGHLCLRELATLMNQNLLSLSQTLASYERRRLIKFAPLPHPLGKASVTAETQGTSPGQEAPLILCIDDSELICKQLGQVVTDAKYRYTSVQNPLEGIQRVLETKPSLIFLDLVMPIISGYELCAQLRRISELRHVPIVILTSSDSMFDRVKLKVAGSTIFLTKPINSSAIQRVLDTYCKAAA